MFKIILCCKNQTILWNTSLSGKSLLDCVSPYMKLHNWYCHNSNFQIFRRPFQGDERLLSIQQLVTNNIRHRRNYFKTVLAPVRAARNKSCLYTLPALMYSNRQEKKSRELCHHHAPFFFSMVLLVVLGKGKKWPVCDIKKRIFQFTNLKCCKMSFKLKSKA